MSGQVHRLALGTASFGMAYPPGSRSPRPTHAQSAEMLRYAYDHGIRCYDTGRAYGDAEDLLNAYLPGQGDITTKIAPDLWSSSWRPNHRLWMRTLLHNPTGDEIHGYADGASVYTPEDALECIKAGMTHIQLPYHILNQSHAKAGVFEAAKAAGVTVYARQPFARGEALRLGFSVEDCLWFALASPADYAVLGVSTLAQLEQDIAVAATNPPAGWPERYEQLRNCDVGLELASVCTAR